MMRHNYLRVGQRILVGFPKINNCSILNWNIWFQTTIFHGQKFQNICCSAKYKNENEISRTVFFKQVAFFKEKIETFPKFAMFLYFLFNNFHHKTNTVLTFQNLSFRAKYNQSPWHKKIWIIIRIMNIH